MISQPDSGLIQHHTRVCVNRERVVRRRDFLRGVSAAGLAAGVLSWTDLMSLHAADLRRRGMACILLWMQGGPSQVDTFDFKPTLEKHDGKRMPFDDARTVANTGARGTDQRVMKSPWKFRQHGASGRWVSELFPEMARHVAVEAHRPCPSSEQRKTLCIIGRQV